MSRTHESKRTLAELLEKYIKEHSVHNKVPKGVRSDRSIAKKLNSFFGEVKLREITPARVSEFKLMCREKGLSASTINQNIGILAHAFSIAMKEWDWIRENPVAKVRRELVRNARDRWLTPREEERLI